MWTAAALRAGREVESRATRGSNLISVLFTQKAMRNYRDLGAYSMLHKGHRVEAALHQAILQAFEGRGGKS